ncbi:phage tail terminator-like protein, partial [Rhizobiaceae sp. 2RAB30]
SNIEAALFARISSLVLDPAIPIVWPNSNAAPAETYLRVSYVPNAANRVFIDRDGPHQRSGVLQVAVLTPKNSGSASTTEVAGKVAAHFPADLPMTSGGLTARVTRAADVIAAPADETHWQVRVSVPYETYA